MLGGQAMKSLSQGRKLVSLKQMSVRGLQIYVADRLHVTDSRQDIFNVKDKCDFEERVLKSDKPVLIDFHARWCKPCKQLTPRLESVMQQFGRDVHLAKVDIDSNDELAAEYQVSAVPVVFGVKDGKVFDKFIGLQNNDRILSFVRKLISK